MHMVKVAVAGASGYAGGEVLRLLLAHPQAEIGALTAHGSAGSVLGEHHPNLVPLAGRELEHTSASVLSEHDVVVLALPHGAAAQIADALDPGTVVIDVSADHRLVDPAAWSAFYPGEHPGAWPYGLPELLLAGGRLQREDLVGARRVAVPGCYPTAVSLALAPGMTAGLLAPQDVVVVAASGTTGAGKTLAPHLTASQVLGSMSPYGVGGTHRHTPEIEQNLAAAAGPERGAATISFTPTLAPMARGILATCTARLAPGPASGAVEQVREVWVRAYAQEPFVHVLPPGRWPRTSDTMGSNSVHLQVALDAHAGRVVVVAAIDNLTKGTAGAAVQCMNLALGLPETTGLSSVGLAP